MTTEEIRNYLEGVFDNNKTFFHQVARAMNTRVISIPDLNNNQTYHIKRVFKKKLTPKFIQSNEYNLINNNQIDVCDVHDINVGRFVFNNSLNVSDIDNIRGFNICILGYDYAITVVEDINGDLHISKVVEV